MSMSGFAASNALIESSSPLPYKPSLPGPPVMTSRSLPPEIWSSSPPPPSVLTPGPQ